MRIHGRFMEAFLTASHRPPATGALEVLVRQGDETEPRAQLFHLQNGKKIVGLSKVRVDGEGRNFKSMVQGHCYPFQQMEAGARNLKNPLCG